MKSLNSRTTKEQKKASQKVLSLPDLWGEREVTSCQKDKVSFLMGAQGEKQQKRRIQRQKKGSDNHFGETWKKKRERWCEKSKKKGWLHRSSK